MAIVTVLEGQRVAFGGRTYGPGDQFDAGNAAPSLVARGLVVIAGAAVEAAPAPPVTIAVEEAHAPEVDDVVPIGRQRRGKGYRKLGDDD